MRNSLLLGLLLFTFSACKKSSNDTNSENSINSTSSVFFKITFNGVTLQTNGLSSSDNTINSLYKGLCKASVTTLSSLNESDIQINVEGTVINSQLNNKSNNVDAILHFKKVGGGVGIYNLPDDPNAIYDTRSSRITYLVDDRSGQINVSKIDADYVYGTFSINLISNNKLIPATGSFKLNKY